MPKLREGAVAARIVAALHAIERHTAALLAVPDPAVGDDFLLGYRRHVVEHHGMLEPPDFERRRRVPIADLYVAPDLEQLTHNTPGGVVPGALPRISIGERARQIDRTVLLGAPGAGKTTASHVLMHHHAGDPDLRTPFLVTLREFASRDRSVLGHIEHRLETFYQCSPPPGLVSRLLLNGAALVIFDGLDELLDTSRRAEMTAVIERFTTEYPNVRVLVTSRIVGYEQARLDPRQFTCYRIGDFDDERVAEYAGKWFAQEEGLGSGEAERWAAAFVEESSSVPDLRANPLMLALMCILYRGERSIPRNRIGVYEQCAQLMFRRWDAQRDIHVQLRASHLVEPTLRYLAYWLFTREETQTAVTEHRLVAETTAFLQQRGFEAIEEAAEAAGEFVGFCRGRAWVFNDAGTTADGEPLFTFTHRTFLEYFAAQHLAVTHDTPENLAHTLAPRIAREQWDIVAELAIQIKDRASDRGAERVVAALLFERRKRSVSARGNLLKFLARCLRSIDLPSRLVRELTRRVLDHVFLTDPARRGTMAVPLGTLLVSCWRSREIVHEEVAARVTAMVDSSDPSISLDGLRLAVSCSSGNLAEPQLLLITELREFWARIVENYVEAYRSQILAASATDPGFTYVALAHDLLTVEQVLAQSNEGLAAIFAMGSTGLFLQLFWSPRMFTAVGAAIGLSGWSRASARTDCAALGRYLTQSWTPPPWNVGAIGWNPEMLTSPGAGTDLHGPEYVGAAIGLLIFAEHILSWTPSLVIGPDALGPLRDLRPYLQQRLGTIPKTALPRLPIPGHVQQAIDAWARGDINLDATTTNNATAPASAS